MDTFLKIRSEALNKSVSYHVDDEQEVGFDEVLQVGEGADLDAPPGMLATLVSICHLRKETANKS